MNTNNPFKKSLDGKTLRYALPLVVVIAVLLAFSSPAAADYSGDKPLTIYEHGTINGSLVYVTVTDGSAYTPLQARDYVSIPPPPAPPIVIVVPKPNWTQQITIRSCVDASDTNCIPPGATVKMARLYNYYTWSTADKGDGSNPGMPAEADIWFGKDAPTVKKVCKHGLGDGLANRSSLANPIDYENGVIQYWDTKGQGYDTACSGEAKKWDDPFGTFAWNVTDMVTGSGTYVAKIQNNDSTPTTGVIVGDKLKPYAYWERFVTSGFGLVVVYEDLSSPKIGYWIGEGCDVLMNRTCYPTAENATTNAKFGGVSETDKDNATLTTVVIYSDRGTWVPPQNMMCFNCPISCSDCIGQYDPLECCIGPSTAGGVKHNGVNYFNVATVSGENVVEFQDRGDFEVPSNAFLVVKREGDTIPPVITCPDDVTVEQETRDGTVVPLTATAIDDCDLDPTITSDELEIYPLGMTTVTFTATDASGNSASCTTTVTVIPISANVTFDKKKLKLNSSGILKAFITLPDGYNVTDINVSTVTCEGALAFTGGGVIPGKQALEAKFKIPDLKEKGVEPGPEVELTVKGEFMDGTQFEGSNTLKVV